MPVRGGLGEMKVWIVTYLFDGQEMEREIAAFDESDARDQFWVGQHDRARKFGNRALVDQVEFISAIQKTP